MTIVCKVELGLLKHLVMAIEEESNILEQKEVSFVEIAETAVQMGCAHNANTILITGTPYFKDELVQEILRLDSRFIII